MSRKPTPRIIPNESRRERTSDQRPRSARAGARQMRSSEFCSSPNTDIAPSSSTAPPTIVPSTPCAGLLTFCSRLCTVAAPSSPISSRSSAKIWPRAASGPNTRPAIEMTISSSGAIENSV